MKRLLKVIRILFVTILTLTLLMNLYNIFSQVVLKNDLPKIFGYSRVAIISGSMSPTIETGDLIIIREASSYQADDIVTFRSGSSLITHRIISIADGKAVTKGDFNNVADKGTVRLSDIEGKMVLRIPRMGDAVLFLRSPLGIFIIIAIAIFMMELPYLFNKKSTRHKGMDDNEKDGERA